jgi:hypothetical protein
VSGISKTLKAPSLPWLADVAMSPARRSGTPEVGSYLNDLAAGAWRAQP